MLAKAEKSIHMVNIADISGCLEKILVLFNILFVLLYGLILAVLVKEFIYDTKNKIFNKY